MDKFLPGKCRYFDEPAGYGVIECLSNGAEFYVEISSIDDAKPLKRGELVMFERNPKVYQLNAAQKVTRVKATT